MPSSTQHRLRDTAACVVLALGLAAAARAADPRDHAIYQVDDVPGQIHLTDDVDFAPGVAMHRLAGETAPPARSPSSLRPAEAWTDIVRNAARTQRLDPALVRAVIEVESGGAPRAVSAQGAAGLMQLMPLTARAYGVDDIFDPRQNVTAGARHLRFLMDRYSQDTARALAAYNAGAGAIDRLPRNAAAWPNAETAAYVPRVLDRYARLRASAATTSPAFTPQP